MDTKRNALDESHVAKRAIELGCRLREQIGELRADFAQFGRRSKRQHFDQAVFALYD